MRVIVAKTPAEYYRVSATPMVKVSPPPQVQPTQPIEPPTSVAPPPPPPVPPTPPPVASLPMKPREPELRMTQVTVALENIREKPQGKIICKVKQGTSMAILEDKGQWLNVRLEDGTEGWIWKASTSEAPKPEPPRKPTKQKPKSPGPM